MKSIKKLFSVFLSLIAVLFVFALCSLNASADSYTEWTNDSYIVWDFEDTDYYTFATGYLNASGGISEYLTGDDSCNMLLGTYVDSGDVPRGAKGSAEIVDKETGEVMFGEHALKINYDFTEQPDSKIDGVCFGSFDGTPPMEGTPTAVGLWLYAPEGTPNLWFRMRVWDAGANNGAGAVLTLNFTERFDSRPADGVGGINWQGWKYCEAELTGEGPFQLLGGECVRLMNCVNYSGNGNKTVTGVQNPDGTLEYRLIPAEERKGYVYIDNVQFVYVSNRNNIEYVIENKEVTITGFLSSADSISIEIPSQIQGYPVTSIGAGAFEDCTGLTSITIPDSVTSIGEDAFYNTGYYNNESNWEDGVLYIGKYLIDAKNDVVTHTVKTGTLLITDYAFADCTGLASITIPDSVTSIGEDAFYNTGYYNNESNWEDGVLYIGKYLIDAKNDVVTHTVKSGTLLITDYAFADCTGLANITICSSVKGIGEYAFVDCISLESITIPSSVINIGQGAFHNTEASVIFSSKYDSALGGNVHWYYDDKTKVLYISGTGEMDDFSEPPEDFTNVNPLIAGCIYKHARTIIINNGVTNIGSNAFRDFEKVTSVVIPSSVASIGKSAFEGCIALETVSLEEGLKTIGEYAFSNTKFSNVSLPYSVQTIGENAFSCIPGLNMTCNYNDPAYKYCCENSISYILRLPSLVCRTQYVYEQNQIKLSIGIKNASGINAVNFTLNYDDTVTPVESGYEVTGTDDLTAVVYNEKGLISVAFIATDSIGCSACSGECEYIFVDIWFDVNGNPKETEFNLSAENVLFNEMRSDVAPITAIETYHEFSSTITPPNCVEAGYITYACTKCTYSYTEEYDEPLGHTYTSVVTEPTCTLGGYTTFSCQFCTHSYIDELTEAKGHASYVISGFPATCIQSGITDGEKCSVCGEILIAQGTVPALTHIDEDGDLVCDSCGEMLGCKDCGRPAHGDSFIEKLACMMVMFYNFIVSLFGW